MRGRVVRIAIAVAVGLAAPYVEVALRCRAPHPGTGVASEACVWTRAYLPLARPLYLIVYGLLTYAALSLLALAWRTLRPHGEGASVMPE
jgi:hypothetical protein